MAQGWRAGQLLVMVDAAGAGGGEQHQGAGTQPAHRTTSPGHPPHFSRVNNTRPHQHPVEAPLLPTTGTHSRLSPPSHTLGLCWALFLDFFPYPYFRRSGGQLIDPCWCHFWSGVILDFVFVCAFLFLVVVVVGLDFGIGFDGIYPPPWSLFLRVTYIIITYIYLHLLQTGRRKGREGHTPVGWIACAGWEGRLWVNGWVDRYPY